MPRTNRTRSFAQRAKRRTAWFVAFSNDFLAVPANSKAGLNLNMAVADVLGAATLVRVRGEEVLFVTGTDDDDIGVGTGLAVVPQNAVGTVASLPGPLTDGDYPWLYHSLTHYRRETGVDEFTPDLSITRSKIDSKAMRKIKAEEDVVWVIETSNAAGTAAISFAFSGRFLFKI